MTEIQTLFERLQAINCRTKEIERIVLDSHGHLENAEELCKEHDELMAEGRTIMSKINNLREESKMKGHLGSYLEKRATDVFYVRKYRRIPRKLKKMLKKQGRYNKNMICYERRIK